MKTVLSMIFLSCCFTCCTNDAEDISVYIDDCTAMDTDEFGVLLRVNCGEDFQHLISTECVGDVMRFRCYSRFYEENTFICDLDCFDGCSALGLTYYTNSCGDDLYGQADCQCR